MCVESNQKHERILSNLDSRTLTRKRITYSWIGLEPLGEALLELALSDLGGVWLAATTAEDIVVAATQSPAASYIKLRFNTLWLIIDRKCLQVFTRSSDGIKILRICWLKLCLAVFFYCFPGIGNVVLVISTTISSSFVFLRLLSGTL